jgi:hypothetical protein
MFESFTRTHYIAHVYVAMAEFLDNHPEIARTCNGLQCAEILDAARKEYEQREAEEESARAWQLRVAEQIGNADGGNAPHAQ